ncbi:hypothetical protein EJP77_08245 [Paenibacillus zeisoli]|uniref:Uncharacterized protein n=1 Tax=Paenibacillus zeisoli TaxID=2496267 RepID=A0A433XHS2_9BACL|nr:hypothetical protein [Paenibacillus zeisoli]RUT33620.1 hypothetical protein EJP77_08245 [Paenibacillus zeisoli]
MKSKSFDSAMKKIVLLGICIGVVLFILTQTVFEVPIVVGTTTYKGLTASLFLLIGSPIAVILIGFISTLFTYKSNGDSYHK